MLILSACPIARRSFTRWSRASASLALLAATAAAAPQGTFLEENGLLVVEIETVGTVNPWGLSTSTPGHVGDGYFRWDGPNLFNSPGASGVFGYDFEVSQTATWTLSLRNRHENPDPTEENDVWIRMDNGPWIKVFSNLPNSVGAWTWESRFDQGSQPQATYALTAGAHRIDFSGRSEGFKMDRFHLHLPGAPGQYDETRPQSTQRFGDNYCQSNPNSTGVESELVALGTPEAAANDVMLSCTDLPTNALGYFIVSQTPVFVANAGGGQGNLCVGGNIGRYAGDILSSGSTGTVSFALDLTAIPRPSSSAASAQAGETWRFQFWHRDSIPSGPTSNFSHGLAMTFE